MATQAPIIPFLNRYHAENPLKDSPDHINMDPHQRLGDDQNRKYAIMHIERCAKFSTTSVQMDRTARCEMLYYVTCGDRHEMYYYAQLHRDREVTVSLAIVESTIEQNIKGDIQEIMQQFKQMVAKMPHRLDGSTEKEITEMIGRWTSFLVLDDGSPLGVPDWSVRLSSA